MKYSSTLLIGLYCLAVTLCSTTVLSAQCTTGCDVQCINQLNISLDQSCQAIVTPGMGGIGIAANDPCYSVVVKDRHGRAIAGNLLTMDYLNQNLTYEVTELECGNLCWGNIKVEYKLKPQIACPPDMTIACNALDYLDLPPATGGCAAFSVQLYGQEKVHLDCDPDYQTYVDRTYVASDLFGNNSTCTHRIYLERVKLDDIIFPGPATISCSDTTMRYNADGFPLPWYYQALTGSGTAMGIPVLCGVGFPTGFTCGGTGSGTASLPLIPQGGAVIIKETTDPDNPMDIEFKPESNADVLCNAVLLYSDVEFPSRNGCTRKIARTWEIFEWWCHEEIIVDALQIIEIKDDRAPVYDCPEPRTVSTTDDCAAEILLPGVDAVDECGDSVLVRIITENGIIQGNGGIATLSAGPNVITYVVSDNCHNSSECTTVFTVKDLTAPVAICERNKVVALSTGYTNAVPAATFDNGSFDDCHVAKFEVRRMDNICTATDTTWSEYVEFCCADVDRDDVMVVFRVSDSYGNSSICMIQVEVQDKSVPVLSCPDDMTISCNEPYDLNNMGQAFGHPEVQGNCADSQLPKVLLEEDMTQCRVGSMTRVFTLENGSGNVIRKCSQTITVTNETPFTYDQITWPLDYEVSDVCDINGLHPDLLPVFHNHPTFAVASDQCAMLGFDFKDKVFAANPITGECAVIERTWTVADWCSTTAGSLSTWKNPVPQLIKITNDIAPVLDSNTDIVVETISGDCNSGDILIVRSAADDCTSDLDWRYSLKTFPSRDIVQMGTTNQISGKFPTGSYYIEWQVSDGCGNVDNDVQKVEIISTKSPTPICHSGLSASLVSMDLDADGVIDAEMVELWASDFDAGSYPACNNAITLSFSRDTTDKFKTFDCDDLGRQDIQMWVTDRVTGIQDFCLAFVDIQDAGNCPDGLRIAVRGEVRTETTEEIKGVEVALGGTTEMRLTDSDGSYAFADMPMGGSYVIDPSHDIDYLNGCSTIDLIRIQRHILGVELLSSPYKLIAADINNSGNINGIDLVELRKLILGIYTELPANDSWRFVSSDYDFIDPTNPWLQSWDENYVINNLNTDMNIDFIGVKIGDVDNTAVVNSFVTSKTIVNGTTMGIRSAHEAMEQGEESSVVLSADRDNTVFGWQGTLEFDTDEIEIIAVRNISLAAELENSFFIEKQNEGWMTMSYNNSDPLVMSEDQDLFEVVIRAKKNIAADKPLFRLSSAVTKAEAYSVAGEPIRLTIGAADQAISEIVKVTPNPWVLEAQITVSMAKSGLCQLDFYNINGQLIFQDAMQMDQGINEYRIEKADLNTTGFVYVRMTVDGESSEYRMMVY